MSRRSRLVIAGVATCVLGIVLLFPARVAYRWFAPPGLLLSGIEGSVWSGSAASAMANDVYVRDLSWRIKPQRLLQGTLSYSVAALPAGGFLDGDIGIGLGGSLRLENLRGSLPLALIRPMTGIPGLAGTVNASINRLTLIGGLPADGDGSIDVVALLLPFVADAPLGNYRAEFTTEDSGNVVANVQDTQAVLDLVGRLLLSQDRTYEFLGRVAATGDTPEQVRRQLQFLGNPNENGQYELRLEGQL